MVFHICLETRRVVYADADGSLHSCLPIYVDTDGFCHMATVEDEMAEATGAVAFRLSLEESRRGEIAKEEYKAMMNCVLEGMMLQADEEKRKRIAVAKQTLQQAKFCPHSDPDAVFKKLLKDCGCRTHEKKPPLYFLEGSKHLPVY